MASPASTILLADASPHARRMGTQYLADLGYTVVTAESASAAWTALERLAQEQTAPALILADASLPGCPGIELCRKLKQSSQWSSIPVLILLGALASASGLDDADGVLRKPLSSAGLQHWLGNTAPPPPQSGPPSVPIAIPSAPLPTSPSAPLSPEQMLIEAVREAARG